MENFKNNTCCIIGHKNILVTNELINKLELVIESLILHFNVTIFLFGSKSEFNDLCYRIVSELKCKHNYIKRVNYPCKGEFYILEQEKDYYENLFKQINKNKININSFDEIILIEEIFKGYKSSYIKRNFKMINESAYGLFYYLEDYVPMQKKRANSMLLNGSRKSGTKLAIEYAQKQNLKIININKEETYQEIIKV